MKMNACIENSYTISKKQKNKKTKTNKQQQQHAHKKYTESLIEVLLFLFF